MLTTTPHLHVRRPSPTTAEFTVTTCPTPTLPLRILLGIVFLVRILVGLSVALLLYSTWTLSPYHTPMPRYGGSSSNTTTTTTTATNATTSSSNIGALGGTTEAAAAAVRTRPEVLSGEFLWFALWRAHASPPGQALARLAARVPAGALLPACGLALYAVLLRVHTTESVLVLRGLGIQTSSTGGSWLAQSGTRFIPTEKIRDVLINEAFRGFEVRYYLVVVVDGEEDVVVVFARLLPKRRIVEAVWRGVRGCLYEPADGSNGVRKMDENMKL